MPWMWNLYAREFMPQRDLKKYPMWFLNFSHSYPAWTPLFGWHWHYPLAHGLIYAANETWVPTIRGSETRNIDGCPGGIVTNGGGSLSHACIHCREYDIPLVSNTGNSTIVIKEGEKIRIDATEGLVFREK
jgi:hypothetical protein